MKYLLIDGNNLAIRTSCANLELTNRDGVTSGVHYGTMQSLIGFKYKFSDYKFLVVWDGKSLRRRQEASSGVNLGLVKSGYKENRPKDGEKPQGIVNFESQAQILKLAIDKLGIPQIRMKDYEADDIIASYCRLLENRGDEVICVTTDKDYYQLLSEKVSIWNGMRDEMITKATFVKDNGIDPKRHVDVGAFSGDSGDNIFGVPGWGDKTSLTAIQKHGGWQETLTYLHKKYDPIRQSFPDVKGDDFKILANLCTDKEQEKKDKNEKWKGKYPEITEDMPFTGVALAFETKKWKPKVTTGVKNEIMALIFEERVKLAYSLKMMDQDIPELPEIEPNSPDIDSIIDYLEYFDIESLKDSIKCFK